MATSTKKKGFICIICPKCCELEVLGGPVISGASCERGEEFARQEAILPLRTITTTLRCETEEGARMVPVKTASPIPLANVLEIMKHIKRVRLSGVPKLGSRIRLNEIPEPLELIVTGE